LCGEVESSLLFTQKTAIEYFMMFTTTEAQEKSKIGMFEEFIPSYYC